MLWAEAPLVFEREWLQISVEADCDGALTVYRTRSTAFLPIMRTPAADYNSAQNWHNSTSIDFQPWQTEVRCDSCVQIEVECEAFEKVCEALSTDLTTTCHQTRLGIVPKLFILVQETDYARFRIMQVRAHLLKGEAVDVVAKLSWKLKEPEVDVTWI